MRRALLLTGLLFACDDGTATPGDPFPPDMIATLDRGLDRGAQDGGLDMHSGDLSVDAAQVDHHVDRSIVDMIALDRAAPDLATPDMAPPDMAPPDMAPPDMTALDQTVDRGGADQQIADMLALDQAPDLAPVDMAIPAPVACAVDADCDGARCVLGRCAAFVDLEEDAVGLRDADDVIAACDADGTIRLLTEHDDDQRLGYLAVGRPGAFAVGGGLAMAANNSTQLTNGTREGTATAHLSFLVHAYRGISVDGRGTVVEDRVITRHHFAHDPQGALWLLTVPRIPGGIDDRHPLHLWRPDGERWSLEEVQRDVGFGYHHHLRFDAAGQPQILRLTGGVGGLVRRYRIDVAGWVVENIWQENLGGNQGVGAAINGPDGLTHALLVSREGDRLDARYLRIGDAGVDRNVPALVGALNHALVTQSLQFDASGNLYFLTYGPVSRQDQRPVHLHRVAPDDTVTVSVVDAIDVDVFGSDLMALAMEPGGDFHLITAPRDGRMRVRTWRAVLR